MGGTMKGKDIEIIEREIGGNGIDSLSLLMLVKDVTTQIYLRKVSLALAVCLFH